MGRYQIDRPLALWKSQDRIDDSVYPSVTAIIRSGGCSWNGCHMCQYRHERLSDLNTQELISRMRAQLSPIADEIKREDPSVVKIYTSGSFFDQLEVPIEIQHEIADLAKGRILIVESRPEYIERTNVRDTLTHIQEESDEGGLIIAIGLETSSDFIRKKCINKGFSFSDYISASESARESGAKIKTYLLFKPPFLTEKEAMDDMIKSIQDIVKHTDFYSMNPCTVQSKTLVEKLWKQRAYRPPYLWSVVSILAQAATHVTCDPIGGGQMRGPHNCRKCDSVFLDAIRDFNISADQELLNSVLEINCSCRKEWEFIIENELPWNMPLTR